MEYKAVATLKDEKFSKQLFKRKAPDIGFSRTVAELPLVTLSQPVNLESLQLHVFLQKLSVFFSRLCYSLWKVLDLES